MPVYYLTPWPTKPSHRAPHMWYVFIFLRHAMHITCSHVSKRRTLLPRLANGRRAHQPSTLNHPLGNDHSLKLLNPSASPGEQNINDVQLEHQVGFGRTPSGAEAPTFLGCVIPSSKKDAARDETTFSPAPASMSQRQRTMRKLPFIHTTS